MSAVNIDKLKELGLQAIDEAMRTGKVTLEPGNDPVLVKSDTYMDLAYKLALTEIKRPRNVSTPEDFELKKTKE